MQKKSTFADNNALGVLKQRNANMKVNPEVLRKFLSHVSFELHGDVYEQEFGQLLAKNFPNCERYWRMFIVPLTTRMDGYPASPTQGISFRKSTGAELQDVSAVHYSAFLNLVYARSHLEAKTLSWLEDFYVHLGSTCDLAEAFLAKWYLLVLKCRGEQTKGLQLLSRDEFMELAGKWYDKKYSTLYNYYLEKGKSPALHLPSRENIVREYLEQYHGQLALWKDYSSHSQSIREFRNVIVHDVQVGKLITIGGEVLIPKPKTIKQYRTWRKVFTAANDKEKIQRDFVKPSQQLKEDLETLEGILNRLWETVIQDCEQEFYSMDRNTLKEMYGIEF